MDSRARDGRHVLAEEIFQTRGSVSVCFLSQRVAFRPWEKKKCIRASREGGGGVRFLASLQEREAVLRGTRTGRRCDETERRKKVYWMVSQTDLELNRGVWTEVWGISVRLWEPSVKHPNHFLSSLLPLPSFSNPNICFSFCSCLGPHPHGFFLLQCLSHTLTIFLAARTSTAGLAFLKTTHSTGHLSCKSFRPFYDGGLCSARTHMTVQVDVSAQVYSKLLPVV